MRKSNRPKRLTDAFVERIEEPGRYGDGRGSYGLSMLVKPYKDGEGFSKSWAQRLYIDGKAKNLGLGSFPAVTLDMAREHAIWNARGLKQQETQRPVFTHVPAIPVQLSPVAPMPTPTFEIVMDSTIDHLAPTWKSPERSIRNWKSRLGKHAIPHIGQMPIGEITPPDISAFLLPLWNTMRPTAVQLSGNLNEIFKQAVARGYIVSNPMDIVKIGLSGSAPKVKHQTSIPYQELAEAIQAFNDYPTNQTNRDLFLLLALTGVRFSQARLAKWREIDFEEALWTSPPEHVKAKKAHMRPHVIPLSTQALRLLRERAVKNGARQDDHIFAQPDKSGKLISERLTLYVLQRAWAGKPTLHGLRTTFATWAQEETTYEEGLIKAAIDHVNGSAADRAYLRSSMVGRRRAMMQAWADYILSREKINKDPKV